MAAEEKNKAIVRRYIEEARNQHDPDAFDELLPPDYPTRRPSPSISAQSPGPSTF